MARLCIRIAENSHPTDTKLDVLRTQPGDVISITEDDHKWSEGELNCGQYYFIDMPGVPPEKLSYLTDLAFGKDGESLVALRTTALALDQKEILDISAVVDIKDLQKSVIISEKDIDIISIVKELPADVVGVNVITDIDPVIEKKS